MGMMTSYNETPIVVVVDPFLNCRLSIYVGTKDTQCSLNDAIMQKNIEKICYQFCCFFSRSQRSTIYTRLALVVVFFVVFMVV